MEDAAKGVAGLILLLAFGVAVAALAGMTAHVLVDVFTWGWEVVG